LICLVVGTGGLDPNRKLSKEVFVSHPEKISTIIMILMHISNPLLLKSIFMELDNNEIKKEMISY